MEHGNRYGKVTNKVTDEGSEESEPMVSFRVIIATQKSRFPKSDRGIMKRQTERHGCKGQEARFGRATFLARVSD